MSSQPDIKKEIERLLSEDLTLSYGTTSAIFSALVKLGVNSERLLAKSNLTIEQLKEDDTLKHVKLWQAADQLLNCPEIGLRVGMRSNPNNRGIVGHVFLKSKNLREALVLVVKYFEILVSYMSMELTTDSKNAYIRFSYTKCNFHRYGIDHIVGAFYNWINVFSNKRVQFDKITYQFSDPHDIKIYKQVFGCQVEYDHSENMLIFPVKLLEIKNSKYNRYLHNILLEHANNILTQISSEVDFIEKVKNIISNGLANGKCSSESVSSSLGMSKRTYQRKLTENNESHQELLDDIRRNAAIAYLGQAHFEIKRLPTILGYADSKGFYRAFKRWTQCSPTEYRNKPNNHT